MLKILNGFTYKNLMIKMKPGKIYNVVTIVVLLGIAGCSNANLVADESTVKIGYFQGGRVDMIYRTNINGFFDQEGVDVKLYTTELRGKEFLEVPKTHEEFLEIQKNTLNFGKVRGTEIVDFMLEGGANAGTIGESSFIQKFHEGAPIVAVSLLGYDRTPGKAIIMRKDVKINSVEDFKGKTLISRRAGPGDSIFLREFIESIGLTPEDLNIINQVDDGDAKDWLRDGKIDGGFYHLRMARQLILEDVAYIYRPMNWMDSAISHALLVFHKDFVKNHPGKVQKVVTAYMKRIVYENSLPEEEKDKSWVKGLTMIGEFQGMSTPQYDFPPKIRIDLLNEVQDLLLKYEYIDEKIDIEEFVDYSFVEKAYTELNIT